MVVVRLAVVTESFHPRVDGVVRTVDMLLGHLRRSGHEAIVFAAGPGPTEHDGFTVVRVPGVTGLFYPDLTIAPVSATMLWRLRGFRPDVVHLASPAALCVYAGGVARLLGVPVAAHYQTDLPSYAARYGFPLVADVVRRIEARFHNSCTVTYAPTPAMAAALRGRGIERVRVCGRGVDAELFRPRREGAAAAARRWPDGDGVRVLCVARLAREKELDLYVEAARRHPHLRCLLVGAGPLAGELAAAAPPNLRLCGALVGEDLADTYAAAQLFAFPSRTETFGQVVQEAMAAGLAVVGMRAGGVAQLVTEEATGVLAASRDEYIQLVGALAGDDVRRARMGAAARRTVASRGWADVLDDLLDDYAQMAGLPADRSERALVS